MDAREFVMTARRTMSANPGVFNSTDEDLVNLFNALGDATRAMQYLRALDPSALPAEDMA